MVAFALFFSWIIYHMFFYAKALYFLFYFYLPQGVAVFAPFVDISSQQEL